jgi:hypothetical protein
LVSPIDSEKLAGQRVNVSLEVKPPEAANPAPLAPDVSDHAYVDPDAAGECDAPSLDVRGHRVLDSVVGDLVDAGVEHCLGDGVDVPAIRTDGSESR